MFQKKKGIPTRTTYRLHGSVRVRSLYTLTRSITVTDFLRHDWTVLERTLTLCRFYKKWVRGTKNGRFLQCRYTDRFPKGTEEEEGDHLDRTSKFGYSRKRRVF